MKKKLLALSLIGFLVFPTFVSPSAAATIQKEVDCSNSTSCDERLKSLGVPQDLILEMEAEKKEDILNSPVVSFDGAITTTYKGGKPISTVTIDENGKEVEALKDGVGDFELYGTIPGDEFVITIDVYTLVTANNRKAKQIYSNYQWKKSPFFRDDDPFGIAWSSKWRAIDNTARNVDYYQHNSTWKVNDDTTQLAYSHSNGVGWHADLRGDTTAGLKGYGKIHIETLSTSNPSGSDQLHTNYGHVKGLVGSIGLSFAAVGVTVTGTRSHDEAGTYKTFTY